MLVEILSSIVAGGILGSTYIYQSGGGGNDHKKIELIAENCGLASKDGKKIRIHRRTKNKGFTEYVYQMPHGLSVKQFQDKLNHFQDGLNIKRTVLDLTLDDIKGLKVDKTLIKQFQSLLDKKKNLRKEVEIEFDGMIIFRVYNESIPTDVKLTNELLEKVKGWEVAIGMTRKELIKHSFEELQMLVVAGMTRYGKTVFLKNAITTLINNQPENLKLTLIDLKGGLAFSRYLSCKQVIKVAKNGEETLDALEAIHDEMQARQDLFLKNGWEDIKEAKWKERHFIVVDEGAEIDGFEKKEDRERAKYLLGEIARIGAGLGYRLIFATQYPTADVFPRQVKANTSAALCFKLKNSTQSIVVLDRAGAESLPVGLRGRAIYQTDCDMIVQTPYISNEFIDIKIKPHINFRPREENPNEETCREGRETRKHSLIIKETPLSN